MSQVRTSAMSVIYPLKQRRVHTNINHHSKHKEFLEKMFESDEDGAKTEASAKIEASAKMEESKKNEQQNLHFL